MKTLIHPLTASAIALAFSFSAYAGTDSGGPGGPGCGNGTLCKTQPSQMETGATDGIGVINPPDPSAPIAPGDTDLDGIKDNVDNCVLIANADQRDTNGDGFGNVCDADLDDDGVVSCSDLAILESQFFMTGDLDADLNGDYVVNASDLGLLRLAFFSTPGPSGIAN